MLAVIGSEPLSKGANIGAAHTDAPRLDLKPRPCIRPPAWMAYLKTHHYGGIRKYHWVTIPLELHGVVVRGDGSTVAVHIGADEGDPQFIINDLLPHLGREQGKKPLNEAIPSESLNLLVGGRPERDDDGSDRVSSTSSSSSMRSTASWRRILSPPSWRPCPPARRATSALTAA